MKKNIIQLNTRYNNSRMQKEDRKHKKTREEIHDGLEKMQIELSGRGGCRISLVRCFKLGRIEEQRIEHGQEQVSIPDIAGQQEDDQEC